VSTDCWQSLKKVDQIVNSNLVNCFLNRSLKNVKVQEEGLIEEEKPDFLLKTQQQVNLPLALDFQHCLEL
jgi:hypothetical protein